MNIYVCICINQQAKHVDKSCIECFGAEGRVCVAEVCCGACYGLQTKRLPQVKQCVEVCCDGGRRDACIKA